MKYRTHRWGTVRNNRPVRWNIVVTDMALEDGPIKVIKRNVEEEAAFEIMWRLGMNNPRFAYFGRAVSRNGSVYLCV